MTMCVDAMELVLDEKPKTKPTTNEMADYFQRAKLFKEGDTFTNERFPKTVVCDDWTEPCNGKILKITEVKHAAFAEIKVSGAGKRVVVIG